MQLLTLLDKPDRLFRSRSQFLRCLTKLGDLPMITTIISKSTSADTARAIAALSSRCLAFWDPVVDEKSIDGNFQETHCFTTGIEDSENPLATDAIAISEAIASI